MTLLRLMLRLLPNGPTDNTTRAVAPHWQSKLHASYVLYKVPHHRHVGPNYNVASVMANATPVLYYYMVHEKTACLRAQNDGCIYRCTHKCLTIDTTRAVAPALTTHPHAHPSSVSLAPAMWRQCYATQPRQPPPQECPIANTTRAAALALAALLIGASQSPKGAPFLYLPHALLSLNTAALAASCTCNGGLVQRGQCGMHKCNTCYPWWKNVLCVRADV